MKILYVNDQVFPCPDTDAEQISQTVYSLASNGEDVTMLLPKEFGKPKVSALEISSYYAIGENFKVDAVGSVFPSFRFLEKFFHAVVSAFSSGKKDFDVVYTRNIPTILAFLIFTKLPVFYETYRPWPRQLFFMPSLFRFIGRKKRFLGAVFHSEYARRSYIDAGLDESKLLTAHNAYDPERIKPVLSADTAREMLNLPKDKKIATYTGNVSIKKGIGLLLDMADAMKDVYFVIVGSKEKSEVESRAESMDNVRIVPWQKFKETVPYLYASDILIIPPTAGPLNNVGNTVLPIKTFLYMATERAIFGPSTPDLAEVLENGRNSVLVEPDNIDAIVEGFQKLVSDDDLRVNVARAAREESKHLTYQARSLKIANFIKEKIKQHQF